MNLLLGYMLRMILKNKDRIEELNYFKGVLERVNSSENKFRKTHYYGKMN